MRDPDGGLRLGPGDRFATQIAPHDHTLVRMRRGWASGGLLPATAVRAVVADPGAVVAHANGAWLARWTDAAQPARPAVRYETADGHVVPPPWPPGRTPLPQEQLPCPACGMPEWERIDDDRRVACARCGYVAGADAEMEMLSSMTIELEAPADGDWEAILAEIHEQWRVEHQALLAMWPHGLWRMSGDDSALELGGWGSSDDRPTSLTLRQGEITIELSQRVDYPRDPVEQVRSALSWQGREDVSVVVADAHNRLVAREMAAVADRAIQVELDGRQLTARVAAAGDAWVLVVETPAGLEIRVHGGGAPPQEPVLTAVTAADVA
jgi:hypothetical protein